VIFDARSNQHSYSNPDTRFWSGPTELMTRPAAEGILAKFIDDVIARLRAENVRDTSAELRWARVQTSRSDHEETEFCEAAGALGADPYAIAEEETDFITQSAALFSGEPLIEFLAGVSGGSLRQDTLNWIRDVESRPPYRSRLPDLRHVAEQVCRATPPRSGDASWALGYRRARTTREVLHKKPTDRLSGTLELARLLGNKSFRRTGRTRGLRALVSMRGEDVQVYLRDRPPTQEARVSEIFAFTRAIGDAICFPNTPRAVVNELHDADRQAAARAFAAEFLAPIDEILSMLEDGADIATIADELNVSTEVVERQFENQHRIKAACDQANLAQ
jgi:IrrE N-terminal-like domain